MADLLRSVLPWSAAHRPEIVTAGRYPMTEDCHGLVYGGARTVALHQHDYEGRVHIGEEPYELRAGDLTLTPAGVESRYHLQRRGYHLCIHFSFTLATAEEVRALHLPCHLRLGASSNPIRQRIWWITDLYRRAAHSDLHKRALALAAASAGLQELLLTLALSDPHEQLTDTVSTRLENALQTLIEAVEARLQEPLAVPALAEMAALSQNYLARVFRLRYGMTIPHFILLRRIELARHLLSTSKATVKQIAQEVGLPDVQHFNKQFRRLVGSSPTAFRAAQRAAR